MRMSNNDTSNMEKRIAHNKPTGMTEGEKIRSWNVIERSLTISPSPFSYTAFLKRAQNKIVAGVLGILILGGSAATAYASNAKPGDLLFPVAIAKEKAQILLTGDQKKKEALRVQFAQKRLAEVRELASLINTEGEHATSSEESSIETPQALSKEETKRVDRAKHGTEVALLELRATREELQRDGNENATNAIEGIISEVSAISLETRQEKSQKNREKSNNTSEMSSGAEASISRSPETQKTEGERSDRRKTENTREYTKTDAASLAQPRQDEGIRADTQTSEEQHKEISIPTKTEASRSSSAGDEQ